MTLETEKYDPVNTHWVRVLVGYAKGFSELGAIEHGLETLYSELNQRALKESKVILSINQSCSTWGDASVIYTITVQVIDRKILEQQQFQQRLSRN